MTTIKSLKDTNFDQLFTAFNHAFKDYEMQVNKEQLHTMITRRGFVPELSFAAFEGEKICSFTLNGIGEFNGKKTAYDTGTGTLEEYRGQGLASKVFEYSIPFLKENGITQYLLEVLQHNTKAVSIYQKAGFEVSREFLYYVESRENIKLNGKTLSPEYEIKPIELPDKSNVAQFWDFVPSWQNDHNSIRRMPEDFISFGAFCKEQLVGYCVFEPNSGDITQLAVDKDHRRKGIASNLFDRMIQLNKYESVKMINNEINCELVDLFLQSKGFSVTGKQFEMIKQLE